MLIGNMFRANPRAYMWIDRLPITLCFVWHSRRVRIHRVRWIEKAPDLPTFVAAEASVQNLNRSGTRSDV